MSNHLRLVFVTIVILAGLIIPAEGAEIVIYSTEFEEDQSFDRDFTLAGQGGWQSSNVGGNGIDSGTYPALGQYAFIGFSPFQDLSESNFTQFVWNPLPQPIPLPTRPLVSFSVSMAISSSIAGTGDDCFRWIAYTPAGDQLFALDFDNESKKVSYVLNDTPNTFRPTGTLFENEKLYELTISMDFEANQWSARLDNLVLVSNQPITEEVSPAQLGDIDAVWAIRDAVNPGDNFMIFDNYRVASSDGSDLPPILTFLGFQNGSAVIKITGRSNTIYEIQAAGDSFIWDAIADVTTSNTGDAEIIDSSGNSIRNQFYRAKLK